MKLNCRLKLKEPFLRALLKLRISKQRRFLLAGYQLL